MKESANSFLLDFRKTHHYKDFDKSGFFESEINHFNNLLFSSSKDSPTVKML